MRRKDANFPQMQRRTAGFSVLASFREALKMPQTQSSEKSMRAFMQVAVYQSIITFINSFSFLVPINRDISEGSFRSGQTNWY